VRWQSKSETQWNKELKEDIKACVPVSHSHERSVGECLQVTCGCVHITRQDFALRHTQSSVQNRSEKIV
jgi:hypothetical protein